MKLRTELIAIIWLDDGIEITAFTKMQIAGFWLEIGHKYMHFWNLQVKDYLKWGRPNFFLKKFRDYQHQ